MAHVRMLANSALWTVAMAVVLLAAVVAHRSRGQVFAAADRVRLHPSGKMVLRRTGNVVQAYRLPDGRPLLAGGFDGREGFLSEPVAVGGDLAAYHEPPFNEVVVHDWLGDRHRHTLLPPGVAPAVHSGKPGGYVVSPDGRLLAAGWRRGLAVFDGDSGEPLWFADGIDGRVPERSDMLVFGSAGRVLAVRRVEPHFEDAETGPGLTLHGAATGTVLPTPAAFDVSGATRFALADDAAALAALDDRPGDSRPVTPPTLWYARADGTRSWRIQGTGPHRDLAISPDGRRVAVGLARTRAIFRNGIRLNRYPPLWDRIGVRVHDDAGRMTHEWIIGPAGQGAIAFEDDDTLLVATDLGGEVHRWHLDGGRRERIVGGLADTAATPDRRLPAAVAAVTLLWLVGWLLHVRAAGRSGPLGRRGTLWAVTVAVGVPASMAYWTATLQVHFTPSWWAAADGRVSMDWHRWWAVALAAAAVAAVAAAVCNPRRDRLTGLLVAFTLACGSLAYALNEIFGWHTWTSGP